MKNQVIEQTGVQAYALFTEIAAKSLELDKFCDELKPYKDSYEHVGEVDMLGEITGLGKFEDLIDQTIEIELYGKKCSVLDIDALITSKKALGRPKDIQIILQLEAIKQTLDE